MNRAHPSTGHTDQTLGALLGVGALSFFFASFVFIFLAYAREGFHLTRLSEKVWGIYFLSLLMITVPLGIKHKWLGIFSYGAALVMSVSLCLMLPRSGPLENLLVVWLFFMSLFLVSLLVGSFFSGKIQSIFGKYFLALWLITGWLLWP